MRANEFINEEINQDVLNPAFNHTQIIDGLTYRATYDEDQLGKKYFQIKVFDDNFEKVGIVRFAPHKDAKGNSWLESLITSIHPRYQGKGIARNIKPSSDQTDQGRGMWNAWQQSGDAEHLMKEEINPDILNPQFEHEQQIGDYMYTAKTHISPSGVLKYLLIKCYDDNTLIARADFEIRIKMGQKWLESENTMVANKYQQKGIASTMYAYAKMLGNTVKPSPDQSDMGKDMWKGWKKSGDAKHLTNEDGGNTTTLAQLYNGNYPDRDETFWDYVSPSEFDTPLNIQTLQRHKVMLTLLGQYRAEHIDEIADRLDDEQQEIVQSYMNDPQLSSKVIVLSGDKYRIIDGNHRALAAALKGVPINYVDLADLDETEVDEDTGIGFRWTGNEKYRKLV